MVVFAKKKDGTIEAREFKDGRWYGWNSWGKPPIPGGGGAIDNPACCSWGGNRLDLFVCGSDNQLWHKWIDDKGITHDWESRGGGLSSGPTATALMAKGRIDVFVRAPDRSIWVNTLTEGHTDHGKWSGWKSYGGRSLSGPSACSRVGSLQVFVFGEDGKIWSRSDASEVWHELPPPNLPLNWFRIQIRLVWYGEKIPAYLHAQRTAPYG